jgi:hypothetical protein
VRQHPRRFAFLLRCGPADPAALRNPAALADQPTLPVLAFAGMRLTPGSSLGRSDEMLYLVRKAPDRTRSAASVHSGVGSDHGIVM